MRFIVKFIIISLNFFTFSSNLGAEENSFFLLPSGSEDPLNLRAFLRQKAPDLVSYYENIQSAKAHADTETLFRLKENYENMTYPPKTWKSIGEALLRTVEGDPIARWPGQDMKQCVGSILFYPQELIHNPEDDYIIYFYPGLAASLVISATFKNAVAIYNLSKGYTKIAEQCRRDPQEGLAPEEEERRRNEDTSQSQRLYQKAIHLFKKTKNPSKVATVYLRKHLHDKEKTLSTKDYKEQLRGLNHPYAFYELGALYEHNHLSVLYDRSKASKAASYARKAYDSYRKALEGGYEHAINGIHRFSDLIRTDARTKSHLYEIAKAQGLFLLAEEIPQTQAHLKRDGKELEGQASQAERPHKKARLKKGVKERKDAKELYVQAGQAGRLYAYIILAEKILREQISSRDRIEEGIFYYQKADRPGLAQGTRRIVSLPTLCPHPFKKIEFYLTMIRLKDIQGYEHLLTGWDIERYHSEIEKAFSSKEEILKDYQVLLQEREKVLTAITSLLRA